MELAYNLVASRKLYRRSEGIDLIYERFAFFLFAGSRVAKRKNIPLIVEVNEIAGEERVRKQAMVG
ncbi:MAG TPA: hypothetical protein DCM54_09015 [Gammaproteobacteria bacterium]|nr:hypothetical protein [Gammaproteobacteria bacterium]|tara:strand:+ start:1633 stop:1830 length:198 start_codon:yes stop_codon:yes gene_type:complete